jgi:hypothetical protein
MRECHHFKEKVLPGKRTRRETVPYLDAYAAWALAVTLLLATLAVRAGEDLG